MGCIWLGTRVLPKITNQIQRDSGPRNEMGDSASSEFWTSLDIDVTQSRLIVNHYTKDDKSQDQRLVLV